MKKSPRMFLLQFPVTILCLMGMLWAYALFVCSSDGIHKLGLILSIGGISLTSISAIGKNRLRNVENILSTKISDFSDVSALFFGDSLSTIFLGLSFGTMLIPLGMGAFIIGVDGYNSFNLFGNFGVSLFGATFISWGFFDLLFCLFMIPYVTLTKFLESPKLENSLIVLGVLLSIAGVIILQ